MIPFNYNCNGPDVLDVQHCYGRVRYDGAVLGSSTDIQLGSISCGTCDGRVSNEMWLSDFQTQDSSCQQWGACWVEAGYATYTSGANPTCLKGSAANCYYWADVRPTSTYYEHPVGNVPSDEYGQVSDFEIVKNSSGNIWDIYISGNDTQDNWHQQSTGNTMHPNRIYTGTEVSGTFGAGANPTAFKYNQWLPTSGNIVWHYQTSTGSVEDGESSSNPTYAFWSQVPSSTYPGGILRTCFPYFC